MRKAQRQATAAGGADVSQMSVACLSTEVTGRNTVVMAVVVDDDDDDDAADDEREGLAKEPPVELNDDDEEEEERGCAVAGAG